MTKKLVDLTETSDDETAPQIIEKKNPQGLQQCLILSQNELQVMREKNKFQDIMNGSSFKKICPQKQIHKNKHSNVQKSSHQTEKKQKRNNNQQENNFPQSRQININKWKNLFSSPISKEHFISPPPLLIDEEDKNIQILEESKHSQSENNELQNEIIFNNQLLKITSQIIKDSKFARKLQPQNNTNKDDNEDLVDEFELQVQNQLDDLVIITQLNYESLDKIFLENNQALEITEKSNQENILRGSSNDNSTAPVSEIQDSSKSKKTTKNKQINAESSSSNSSSSEESDDSNQSSVESNKDNSSLDFKPDKKQLKKAKKFLSEVSQSPSQAQRHVTGKIIEQNEQWSLREKEKNHQYCVDNIAIDFVNKNSQKYFSLKDFETQYLNVMNQSCKPLFEYEWRLTRKYLLLRCSECKTFSCWFRNEKEIDISQILSIDSDHLRNKNMLNQDQIDFNKEINISLFRKINLNHDWNIHQTNPKFAEK